ncbi:permease [Pseudomonas aeruginosa]
MEALLPSSGKRGYFLAAGLGAITPFCSCSTIPMLKGLIRARAGFGPMMVFLSHLRC